MQVESELTDHHIGWIFEATGKEMESLRTMRAAVPQSCFLLFAVLPSIIFSPRADAKTYRGVGTSPETSYVIYIPDKLNLKTRHPCMVGFDPGGDATAVLSHMSQACDDNGWILVASNNYHNGCTFEQTDLFIADTIASAIRTLAVDPTRIYVGGLSGGGQVSHGFIQKHPELIRGLVTNCGMINQDYLKENGYPSGTGKAVVFLTNPGDFRYKEIAVDCRMLKGRGWTTSWMEFPGNHEWAPPKYFSAAFKWLDKQAAPANDQVVKKKP